MKDDNVIFDFIQHKMLKLDERVIYADKKVYLSYNDMEDDELYYKVLTISKSGTVRKYVRFLNTANKDTDKWMLMNTL